MATVVFGYMAYSYYQNNKKELAVASGALAILFQPFVKLALGRGVWNFVDIVVAIGLYSCLCDLFANCNNIHNLCIQCCPDIEVGVGTKRT